VHPLSQLPHVILHIAVGVRILEFTSHGGQIV
jgi:hypothetical protein